MPEARNTSSELTTETPFIDVYRDEINRILLTGEVQAALELSDAEKRGESFFGVSSYSQKAGIVTCNLDSHFAEVESMCPVGSDIKLITTEDKIDDFLYSRRDRRKKKKKNTSVLNGEITALEDNYFSGSFLELKMSKKQLLKGDLTIRPAVNFGELRNKFSILRNVRCGKEGKKDHGDMRISELTQHFLEGDFIIPEGEMETNEKLDESQNRAYGMAMAYEGCPIMLVHGGPGSGKTTTICEAVKGHIKEGRKVLVLSHSNRGAQVPALKLKKEKIKVHIAGNHLETVDKHLHRDRIRRKLNYPTEKLRAITNMDDETALEKAYGYSDSPESADKKNPAIGAKKLLRKLLLKDHSVNEGKAEKRFQRSMKKGGVAFSTLGNLYVDSILKFTDFDVVIVDEATRFHAPDLLLALQTAGKQIMFVGDPMQLGNIPLEPKEENRLAEALDEESGGQNVPVYENEEDKNQYTIDLIREELLHTLTPEDAEEAIRSYNKGPFSRIILSTKTPEKDLPCVFLDQNRRSLPNIVRVLSDMIYGGKMRPARAPKEGEGEGVVRFLDTSGIESTEKISGTSRKNPAEAEQIVRAVLDKIFKEKIAPEDIGVIATYKAQAELIKSRFKARLNNNPRNRELYKRIAANVDTVDAFQGSERKTVFVSLTRSFDDEKEEGKVGFLEEKRRIGVAIGRAQDELYVVGDLSTVVDRNQNEESKLFFTRMRDSIQKHGEIEAIDNNGGRRRSRSRGKGRKRPRAKKK